MQSCKQTPPNIPTPKPFRLSMVVPCFNEAATVGAVVRALLDLSIPGHTELVVVDDGSADATGEILDGLSDPDLVVLHHLTNRGKGAAVRTGLAAATGTHLLVFDADDEYDPADISRLVDPILSGRADVVYGSRMSGFGTVHPSLHHAVGNHLMTWAANLLYGSAISDLHTCLKLLPLPLIRSFHLDEEGFGLDTEISAEMLRAGFRPFEVPVSYVGRSKEEGKKIRSSDALRCIYVLVKVRLRGTTHYGRRNRSLAPSVSTPIAAQTRPVTEVIPPEPPGLPDDPDQTNSQTQTDVLASRQESETDLPPSIAPRVEF